MNFTCIRRIDNISKNAHIIQQDSMVYWIESIFQNSRYNYSIYSICLTEKGETQPKEKLKEPEWYREITYRYAKEPLMQNFITTNFIGAKAIKMNRNRDIFLLSEIVNFTSSSVFFNQVNFDTSIHKGSLILTKYDSTGNLIWNCSYGDENMYRNNNNNQEFYFDNNGDIIVTGQFFKKTFWGDIEEDFNGVLVKRYLAKIDGKTGKFLWHKTFNPTRYINPFRIEELVLDKQNNIYVTALYENFRLFLNNQLAKAEKSPINALLKFNPSGEIQWIKNIETPWLDRYGRTHVMQYDSINNFIYTVQSQDGFTTSSSCKFSKSHSFIQKISLDGDVLETKEFSSDDMLSTTSGGLDDDQNLFGFGFVRGILNLENFSHSTARQKTESCNIFESFYFKYDNEAKKNTQVSVSKNYPSRVISSASDGDYVYALCYFVIEDANPSSQLLIVKFDKNGKYVGYKPISEMRFDQYKFPISKIDVSNGFIAVASYSNTNILDKRFNNTLLPEEFASMGLWMIKDEDWKTDLTLFQQLSTKTDEASQPFKIYPNPTSNDITVAFQLVDAPFHKYELYDINGKMMQMGNLNSDLVQKIELGSIGRGIYILRCYNEQAVFSAKVIKL